MQRIYLIFANEDKDIVERKRTFGFCILLVLMDEYLEIPNSVLGINTEKYYTCQSSVSA